MKRVSGERDSEGNLQRLGLEIRRRRAELSISQEELAHRADIDRGHMGKIERGERNLTLLNLVRVSHALACLPSDLLAGAGL